MNRMNRRNFFKLCNKFGLSAASYPLLHALPSLAQTANVQATSGKRFMVIYNPLGYHQPTWTTGRGHRSGNQWKLTDSKILAALDPLKEKINVIEGVSREGNRSGQRHQQGMVGLLTARELGDEGMSIDQMTADAWNTKVLNLGVQVQAGLDNNISSYDFMRISFRGRRAAGAQVANNNPWNAFQQTFGAVQAADPYESFASNRSVLDLVLDDIRTVQDRLSTEDRLLLEYHQNNIRELECRLHGAFCNDEVSEAPVNLGTCTPPQLIEQPNNVDQWLRRTVNMPTISRLQGDIAAAAMVCNLAPVSIVQHSTSGSQTSYSWVTNDQGRAATSANHHDLSHSIYTSTGALRDHTAIHQWYTSRVLQIVQQLDSVPEGDGTVLDNSLVLWGSCLGNPHRHWNINWPAVTFGSLGGFFKTNQSLDFRQPGKCVTDPLFCFQEPPSGTSNVDLLNTFAAGLGLGATPDRAVVGNLTGEDDASYVGRAYHGFIDELLA